MEAQEAAAGTDIFHHATSVLRDVLEQSLQCIATAEGWDSPTLREALQASSENADKFPATVRQRKKNIATQSTDSTSKVQRPSMADTDSIGISVAPAQSGSQSGQTQVKASMPSQDENCIKSAETALPTIESLQHFPGGFAPLPGDCPAATDFGNFLDPPSSVLWGDNQYLPQSQPDGSVVDRFPWHVFNNGHSEAEVEYFLQDWLSLNTW